MDALTREQRRFLRIAHAYIAEHPRVAFRFSFDGLEQPTIGNSSKIINVNFLKAAQVFTRIFYEGSLGLGESYCEGLIEVRDEDYKELLLLFAYTASPQVLLRLGVFDMLAIFKARTARAFVTRGSEAADINSHYSLSDWFSDDEDSTRFYFHWLTDDYRLYTSAKWDPETTTLNEGQINKLEFYAKRLGINKSSRGKTLLDLGCGWGGILFFMAERFGLTCRGLTLSTAQYKYIDKEIQRRGLQNLITVELKNAHDMAGTHDYVVSVGLLEHITRHHDLYNKIRKVLRPGGKALLHCIYHTKYFHKTDAFLAKYIFPGGTTPHFGINIRRLRKYFEVVDNNKLPHLSYPKTLDCWFANFCQSEPQIRELLGKSKVPDVNFAIRVFKHYLVLSSAGLTYSGFVANTVLANPA